MPKTTARPTLPIPVQWEPLINGYLRSLAAIGRPATTIELRRQHLGRISRALGGDPVDVTPTVLRDWFAGHRTPEDWAIETRRSYRNTAASFFGWAHTYGHLPANAATEIPPIGADHPVPRPAPDRVWITAKMAADPRITLMLRLACEAGLRRGEVARVHTDDLREEFDGAELLVHGKGGRERMVPITDDLASAIRAGSAGHTPGGSHTGWLFPSQHARGHLSPKHVGTLCSSVMPGVWTMHTLRHRFATNAYRGSRDIRAVQELLGHQSVATTQRYTAVDRHERRAAMMSAAQAS